MNPTVWIEINLDAIRHNLREVRRVVGDRVKILAVVKSNAYGSGAVAVSKAVLAEGAESLAVTRFEDAVELREASIDAPILVFSPILPEHAAQSLDLGLDLTVCSAELARVLSAEAAARNKTARIHVKVDTGMGRLGVPAADAVDFVKTVKSMPGLEVAGVYTHFATASEKDRSASIRQMAVFDELLNTLKADGISYGMAHAAASAALLAMPDSRYDMVRPGTVLYGQYPSSHVPRPLNLKDPWTMKTRIVLVREVARGQSIGYGAEYHAKRDLRIAIIPVGYADGPTMQPESVFRRNMALKLARQVLPGSSTALRVKIQGKHYPVVGRVAMEMCCVDITDNPIVQVGEEVVLPCRRTAASSRIPRVYID